MAAELVGLIASVATLAKIIPLSFKVLRKWSAIPSEITQISEELLYLSHETQIVHGFLKQQPDLLDSSDQSLVDALNLQIKQAETNITAFHDRISYLTDHVYGTRGQLRWLVLRSEEAASLLDKLQRTRTALNVMLHLYAWSVTQVHWMIVSDNSSLSLRSQHMEQMQAHAKQKQAIDRCTTLLADVIKYHREQTGLATQPCTKYCCVNNTLPVATRTTPRGHSSKATSIQLSALGSHALMFAASIATRKQYDLGFSVLLNLPYMSAVLFNLCIRINFHRLQDFGRLPGPCLSFVNLVEENSQFVIACAKGDVPLMRTFLQQGQASFREITPDGWTPMSEAIKSGNIHAVKLLLDEGADPNQLHGRLQVSPLAEALRRRYFDIARLLLSKAASCDHLTGLGWTPLFYLWSEVARTPMAEKSAEGLIRMLAASPEFGLSHHEIIDTAGFGVIHMATCNGTAAEVSLLIKYGVSVHALNGPLQWTAIHNAVFYNRPDTFEALLPHYSNFHIDTPDTRGWTLLHIAASAGHVGLTERLLQLGANWQARSLPSDSHMPESLYYGSWTPAQVAQAQSNQRKISFLDTVRKVLGEAVLSPDEVEELDEVWYDAR